MSLWNVKKIYKDGSIKEWIEFTESKIRTTYPHQDPEYDLIQHHITNRIVYKVEDRRINPTIICSPRDNKHYIVPHWIECHPQATLDDIAVVKAKPVLAKGMWKFKSSSGDGEYTVRQSGLKLTCNCPGRWKAKAGKCKHVKEVEAKYL